jgi:membrane protein implicated in regulation of membrane protease activity
MGIIKAIREFIVGRGFTLMIFGISAAAAGVLLYAFVNTPRYASTIFPKAAVGLSILGFASYLVGRVSIGLQHKENKRRAMQMISGREEDSFEPPPENNGKSGAQ